MRPISLRLLFLLFFLGGAAALAGPNHWTTSGPDFASVIQIITDPADPAVAYALTSVSGVFKTSDSGDSWQVAKEGLPASASMLIALSGSPTPLMAAVGSDLYVSQNGGDHWLRVASLAPATILSFAYDEVSHVVYAGTNEGLYRSSDAGLTWTKATGSVTGINIFSIAVAPDTTVYAISTGRPGVTGLLLRSKDQGRSWEIVTGAPPAIAVAIDQQTGTIYLRNGEALVLSTDHAATWKKNVSLLPLGVRMTSLGWANAGKLYTPTNEGVFSYDVRSGSWSRVGATLTTVVRAVAVSSTTPSRFYAATDSGIDIGVGPDPAWTPSNRGLARAAAFDVAVSSDGTLAYATVSSGVYKTDDNGQTWQQVFQTRGGQVEVSRDDGNTVYAETDQGLQKSTDAGGSWSQVRTGRATLLALAPSDPRTLYAMLADNLIKTSDGGTTWGSANAGLPFSSSYSYYYGLTATDAAVDPSNASTAYVAGGGEGLFVTTDGGGQWKKILGAPTIWGAAVDRSKAATIYAATSNGVLKSIDAGATWTSSGLIDKEVTTLTTAAPSVVFAGSSDGGVYRSDDGGNSWISLEPGLPGAPISRLSTDSTADDLYAATTSGVFEYHVENSSRVFERQIDDQDRVSRLVDELARVPADSALIFPIAGSARGISGTAFTSELSVSNERDADQQVLVVWISPGASPTSLFRFALPAHTSVHANDLSSRLNHPGIGSLIVIGVDANGERADPGASLSSSLRIWIHPADGRAPFAQDVAAVRPPIASHAASEVGGLQNDKTSRTNVGVVNLSKELHHFTITANGDRASSRFSVDVPPLSLVQMSVPDGDYGALSLTAVADSTSTRWLFYGSSINNTTSEAHTSVGVDR